MVPRRRRRLSRCTYQPPIHSSAYTFLPTYLHTRVPRSRIFLSLSLSRLLYIYFMNFNAHARLLIYLGRGDASISAYMLYIYAHFVAARDDFNRRAGLFFRQINGPRVYYQAFRCSGDSRYGPTQCEVLCQSIRKMLAADSVCILIVRRMLCYAHACILSFLIKRTRICICVYIYRLVNGFILIPRHHPDSCSLPSPRRADCRNIFTRAWPNHPLLPITSSSCALDYTCRGSRKLHAAGVVFPLSTCCICACVLAYTRCERHFTSA